MKNDLVNKKLIQMILAVISVYGPLNIKEIKQYVKKYFSYTFTGEDEQLLDVYLDGLLYARRIYLIDDKYSSLTAEVIEETNKVFGDIISIIGNKKKEYPKDELIKYDSFEKLYGIREFDNLKKYYDSLIFKNNKSKNELFLALCFGLYSCFDIDNVINEIEKETLNFDDKELKKYLKDFDFILPRPFLNGFTYKDIYKMKDELEKEMIHSITKDYKDDDFDELFTDKYKIKTKIRKKPYGHFSYEDCMELTSKVAKTEIFKLIDSDKVLEFFLNGKPTYVQILGYYGKDKAIMLFKSKKDMINTHTVMISEDEDAYPDMPMHISCIEISYDNANFLNEDMKSQLVSMNLPFEPNFSVLEANKMSHLPDQNELDLIGAVLSDIIKLVQLSNLSDIKLNLGETTEMYDIYQVYVGEDEVLYGKYNDIRIRNIILNFDLDNVDEKLARTIKRYKNYDIEIGTYISYYYVQDIKEYPHIVYVLDRKTKKIIDCMLKKENEMLTIKNDVLKSLFAKKMNPRNIFVNNDYCYEIFREYGEYFNIDFVDDDSLNYVFQEFCDKSEIMFDEENKTIYKA